MHPGKDIQEHTLAFQRGEEKGFNYFFRTLYPSLVYFAFTILNDKQTAEEIVEDAFVRLWENERHKTFDHHLKIKSWLYTTVRNKSINKLKQVRVQVTHEQAFARLHADDAEPVILQTIVQAEFLREIHFVINSLPKECRKVFKMLYIEGKTVREIAAELRLSISTVKTQKAKGISYLRAKLLTIGLLLILHLPL